MSEETKRKGRIILKNLTKEQRKKILNLGGGAFGSAAGNAGIISLMSFVSRNDAQAAVPQSELLDGANTGVEPIVIYTEAPFAGGISDDMSFNEAFATARAEVGAGGIFEWKGNSYNTYTREEYDNMTDDQQDAYGSSIEGQIVSVEETTEAALGNDSEIIEGQLYDYDGDGEMDSIFIDADGDDELDLLVDLDGDQQADGIVFDISSDELEELEGSTDEVVVNDDDLDDFESSEFDLDDGMANNTNADIDLDDSTDIDAGYDIENDMDMNDFV
jgi:hypothetical protein